MAKQIKMMFAAPVTAVGGGKELNMLYALTTENQMYVKLLCVNMSDAAPGHGAKVVVDPTDAPGWYRVPDIPDDI